MRPGIVLGEQMATMVNTQSPPPLSRKWWFRVLIFGLFLLIPPYSQLAAPNSTSIDIITRTLADPLAHAIPWLLPVAKVLLVLFGIILPLVVPQQLSGRVLLGYYAAIIVLISIFQNTARTDLFGFTWLIGNTVVQLIVVACCLADLFRNRTILDHASFRRERLWLVIPILLALLMPYITDSNSQVVPSLRSIFVNEAGVTYCMVTPIIIGLLLLFPAGVYKPTLSIVSFVALLFAIVNMLVWFVLDQANWWMGVLHLPLLITGVYGLIEGRRPKSQAAISGQ